MSDNIQNNGNSQGNIMKELSDIKTSLAVNTNETQTIKESINEVKGDVKEMKKNYVNQEQYKVVLAEISEHKNDIEKLKINTLTNKVLLGVGTFLLLVVTGMMIYHLFGIKI